MSLKGSGASGQVEMRAAEMQVVSCEDKRALHGVLQFAHISRPGVLTHQSSCEGRLTQLRRISVTDPYRARSRLPHRAETASGDLNADFTASSESHGS